MLGLVNQFKNKSLYMTIFSPVVLIATELTHKYCLLVMKTDLKFKHEFLKN